MENKFSFADSGENAIESSQDSFQMGGPQGLWRDLHTLSQDILSNYNRKIMAQAVSRGNSRDPSPRDACDTKSGTVVSKATFDYADRGSDGGDVPLLGGFKEGSELQVNHLSEEGQYSFPLIPDITLDQIVAMTERNIRGADTSIDSLNSQDPQRAVLKPTARLTVQDNVNGKDEEIENIENDYELSCSKEDDSGFGMLVQRLLPLALAMKMRAST